MLNYVNDKIPNNLNSILESRGLTISDVTRISGMTRPTVKKLVDGDDSYLSKMAHLCDCLDISMSEAYGKSYIHQENHGHDNSKTTMIGIQHENFGSLMQRVRDLEDIIKSKDELLDVQRKLLKLYETDK